MWLAVWVTGAWACGQHWESKVVGSADGGRLALVRREVPGMASGTNIVLDLVALDTGAVTRSWTILTESEDEAVRGPRWAAAEKELAASGVTLDPRRAPLAASPSVRGHQLAWSVSSEDLFSVARASFDGAEGRLLWKFPIDDGIAPPVAAVYAMPGEAWVALVSQSGCMTPIPAVVGLRVP